MGEIMREISFESLLNWALTEYKTRDSVFGVRKNKFYKNTSGKYIQIFGDKIASPIGPAAGPNSQLAQNILASYLAGSRFFEVKTVQKMDGEELRKCVPRPCIKAEDEGYNVEWSTELTVQAAFDEYVKGWFLIHVLAKEFGITDTRDFAFNMSVGYDLDGIKTKKIDDYINGMIDATNTEIFKQCKKHLLENISCFENVTATDIENISPAIAPSITISTLHGCPPQEIERIANYLLTEKKIHTFIKCNPTLLGYEFARKSLDDLGYDYLSFTDHHFNNDLQFKDAIPMLTRLLALSKELNLEFGVKITNTFPVKIENNELPGEEMYMSGRSLFPLSINVARKLSNEFNGELQISYSGGADFFNIKEIYQMGIQPITVATTILKPGGYERLQQLAETVEPLLNGKFEKIDVNKLNDFADTLADNPRNLKSTRKVQNVKNDCALNLFDCFIAPCKDSDKGCPIDQQIPEYMNLVSAGEFEKAFEIIQIDNALPSVTGTICDHQCQNRCTRIDYDSPVQIREGKRITALTAQEDFISQIKNVPLKTDAKVVIIGAGPAGVAASYYLRRNGIDVTVLEKKDRAMGIVEFVIPSFRISHETIKKDYEMAVASGVNFVFNVDENYSVENLKKEYDYVIIATGAWKEGVSPVKEGADKLKDALRFLEESKANNLEMNLGKRVAVIGAGDVAMDTARAAKKSAGTEEVCIVYRRTRAFMPAQFEEIEFALNDGVKIMELLSPVSFDGKTLKCEIQKLTEERDASGRKMMTGTGEFKELEFDTVIGAVGARVDSTLFEKNGLKLDKWNSPELNNNLETNLRNVFVAGDCKAGAATIVKAMADAKTIAKTILADAGLAHDFVRVQRLMPEKELYNRKGVLTTEDNKARCLSCSQICEVCCDVCPNRANFAMIVNSPLFKNSHQILHVDGMCNECGNCGSFCPHAGVPYKDKISLFWTHEDFEDSANKGFLKIADDKFKVRKEDGTVIEHTLNDGKISAEFDAILKTVLKDYGYLFVTL